MSTIQKTWKTPSPELAALMRKTAETHAKDLVLTEVSQDLYEQAYEFLITKYGTAFGRTNIMLNGHLITPDLKSAHAAAKKIL